MRIQVLLLLTIALPMYAQSTFCDGWNDGYSDGMKKLNDNIYITPICPIPSIFNDTYQAGYKQGLEKATGESATVVVPYGSNNDDDAFCGGWEKGYGQAMADQNKSIFIVPICPIPGINENTFGDGFRKGYQKGMENVGTYESRTEIKPYKKTGDFCDGWEDGYKDGMESINDKTYSIPFCPFASINHDTYEDGYKQGYVKATEQNSNVVVVPYGSNEDDGFCGGWDKGFEQAMKDNGRTHFNTPFCPSQRINENSFDDGFARGYQKGMDQLGVTEKPQVIVPSNKFEGFCDGWERGYQYGLQEWAIENNEYKPNRTTPTCPNPGMNEDNYTKGFEKGKERAKEEMND